MAACALSDALWTMRSESYGGFARMSSTSWSFRRRLQANTIPPNSANNNTTPPPMAPMMTPVEGLEDAVFCFESEAAEFVGWADEEDEEEEEECDTGTVERDDDDCVVASVA